MKRFYATVNFQPNVPLIAVVRHPDEADEPVIAGEPAKVRVYGYSPTGATPGYSVDASGPDVAFSRSGSEWRQENAEHVRGWAEREYWDREGRTRSYNSRYRDYESWVAQIGYFTSYRDYLVTADAAGDHTVTFYYGASPETADASAAITLTAEASGGGAATPQLRVARTDSDPINPGVAHTVRVFYYHPDANPIETWAMSGVTLSAGSAGTEEITETVQFRFGVGNTSRFDALGRTEARRPDLADQPVAFDTVTYDAAYRDYNVTGTAPGVDYAAVFYYEPDGWVEQIYSFQCAAPDPSNYSDETNCEAAGYYWYNGVCNADPAEAGDISSQSECEAMGWYWYAGACHATPAGTVTRTIQYRNNSTNAALSGVSVWVDGVLKGTTDGDGNISISGLIFGESYQLRATKTGFIDTDEDEIANDDFTVQ